MKTSIVQGELPYRIEIGGLLGAGDTPARAVLAALRVGRKVPQNCNAKEAAQYIFWHYEANPIWVRLIHILEKDTFKEASDEVPLS